MRDRVRLELEARPRRRLARRADGPRARTMTGERSREPPPTAWSRRTGVSRHLRHRRDRGARAARRRPSTSRAGELVACAAGPGSGKTTLLNCIGGLDRPTRGTRRASAGREVTALAERELRRAAPRRRWLRVPDVRADPDAVGGRERRACRCGCAATPAAEREERVALLLELVGLAEHARSGRPSCPAASSSASRSPGRWPTSPGCCIADEPTGQLDPETGRQIMQLLRAVVRAEGITALVATHDPAADRPRRRVLQLEDGQLAIPAAPQCPA